MAAKSRQLEDPKVLSTEPKPPFNMIGAVLGTHRLIHISTVADLGQRVRTAREAVGLSQQEFADAAGVGRRFVSELENGKPTLEFDKVLRAARAAGIDLFAMKR